MLFYCGQIKDSSARDVWVKERHQSINKVREAEKNADNVSRSVAQEKMQWVRENTEINSFIMFIYKLKHNKYTFLIAGKTVAG